MNFDVAGWLKGSRPTFWGRSYRGGILLFGLLGFLFTWFAATMAAGFAGFMIGWLPSLIVGALVGLLWPLLATVGLGTVLFFWVGPRLLGSPQPTAAAAYIASSQLEETKNDARILADALSSLQKETEELPALRSACQTFVSSSGFWRQDIPASTDAAVLADDHGYKVMYSTCSALGLPMNVGTIAAAKPALNLGDELRALCSDMAKPWTKALIAPASGWTSLIKPALTEAEKEAAREYVLSDARRRRLLDNFRVVCGLQPILEQKAR